MYGHSDIKPHQSFPFGHTLILFSSDEELADIVFVNSCIVTGKAEKESRKEASHFSILLLVKLADKL